MSENAVTSLSVTAEMTAPGGADDGAPVMLGRTAGVPSGFSRYGGVKICPSGWFCLHMKGIEGVTHVSRVAWARRCDRSGGMCKNI